MAGGLRSGCAALALALAGCGGPGAPPPAQPYADPGWVEAGGVRLHYALTPTMDLSAEIAGSYGIVRKRNLALLLVTLAPAAGPGGRLAAAELDATAVSLTGERTPLALGRRDEPGGPSYLAMIGVRDREPVTIELRARVEPGAPELAARFTRALRID